MSCSPSVPGRASACADNRADHIGAPPSSPTRLATDAHEVRSFNRVAPIFYKAVVAPSAARTGSRVGHAPGALSIRAEVYPCLHSAPSGCTCGRLLECSSMSRAMSRVTAPRCCATRRRLESAGARPRCCTHACAHEGGIELHDSHRPCDTARARSFTAALHLPRPHTSIQTRTATVRNRGPVATNVNRAPPPSRDT